MKLTLLHIISFGGLSNREIRLDDGVNVLYGPNESGKSSVAMFVKFIFYGLSAKSPKSGEPSERARYINRLTGQAAGYLLLETDEGVEYRIERAILTSDNSPSRERVRIINRATGEALTGQNPGEYFFGVSEDVFLNTCFVGQNSLVRPDAGSVSAAALNILSSADETVDVGKAIRAIDNVRREICHKNGSGGELSELREQRDALTAEMQNASGRSAEIIRVSSSLDDIKKRIAELEEDKRRCYGISGALDKILLKRRIDSAEAAGKNIAALDETLAELDASPLGPGFAEAVDAAERDLLTCPEFCAVPEPEESEEPDEPAEPSADDTDTGDPTSIRIDPVAEAQHLDSSAHFQFTMSMALFVAGLFGLGVSLLMYYFNTDLYVLPLLMTLVFVTLGVVFILRHSRTSASLIRLLTEYGTETIDELEELSASAAVDKTEESGETNEALEFDNRTENPDLLTPDELRYQSIVQRLGELCAAAGVELREPLTETIAELRTTVADIRADRDAMLAKRSNLCGKLEVLNEQLANVDRVRAEYEYQEAMKQSWGKTAASLNADGVKAMMRERDFTNSALKSAEKRRDELELRLAELGPLTHSPDETATAIDAIDRKIEELELRHDACELAKTALTEAGEAVRSGVIPKIAKNASILLSGATSGTHENLTLDANFTAGCSTDTDILSNEYLSRGTSDLAYLSLRIALAEEIFKTESPFFLFDESLAHVDTARIEGITSLLLDTQSLILTCRREESLAAERGGAVRFEM